MIALTYINKVSATIEAMKDYNLMQLILATTSQEVKDANDTFIYVNTPKNDGMPKTLNGNSCENILVNHLSTLDIIIERYKQAVEYMQWFEPAWQSLKEEQRLILYEFYMKGNQRSGASKRIQEQLNYSERQVERIRKVSLTDLTNRLYGR